jgi:signal peptidase I
VTTTSTSEIGVAGSGHLGTSPRRAWRWGIALVLVLLVVALLRGSGLGTHRVTSDSMEPTLRAGDVVLVDPFSPHWRPYAPGDLVVFHSPEGGLAVKRVVGVAGDRVEIRDAVLYVDGRPVREPYVDLRASDALYYGPVVVTPRHLLLMGDNRPVSIDSRAYGPVSVDRVVGRVLAHS